tara:strand:+ start:4320 stop:7601 length:3282 start_codon:yes stop_codon:yes gene_type:complete
MAQLAGFKESGMRKIADRMGYTGPMTGFQAYLQENPDKQQMMNSYVNKAMLMASGGYVRKFQEGGFAIPEGFNPDSYLQENPDVQAAIEAGQFTSAADHFQKFGGGEERTGATGFTPPPQFDATSYLEANPDVGQAIERGEFQDARDHFQKFGGGEDREGVTGPTATQPSTGTQPTQPPPTDDTVTQQPSIQPDPDRTFATFQDLQNTPREFLTPEQVHILNFYSSTPEQQQAINAMPEFRNAQLPVGQYQPGVRVTAPTQQDPQPPAGDTVSGATGVGSVNGAAVLANRPDVAQAIQAGNTFGVDPATLEGLTPEQRNQRLAEAWFNTFGNQEGVNPNTGLSNTPSNFDNVSDQIIMDYLDQFPDLREAFGGPPYTPAILAQARAHYADFGRREIAEGNRPRLVQFDLTPAQLEAFRYSNDAYENLTPTELRRTYIQIGGAAGATNFDRNAQILNNAELAIYRDNNPDLANLSDFELRQHFIQFGRQEMLQGTRPKIDALVPPVSPYAGQQTIGGISTVRLETPTLVGDTKLQAQKIAQPGGAVPTGTTLPTTTGLGQVTGDLTASVAKAGTAATATATPLGPDGASTVTDADFKKAQTTVEGVTTGTEGQDVTFTPDAVTGRVLATPKAAQQVGSAVTGIDAPKTEEVDKAVAATRPDMTPQETVLNNAIAENAAKFVEEIAAATATPTETATVKGQLTTLLAEFEKVDEIGNPINPPWAAGAMRAATAEMVRRGLGSSSIAGQAIVQAAMEAALPIAQADAQIQAQFEGQNLSNRQQMAAFYAQQRATAIGQEFTQEFQARVTNAARVADIADRNFTAEQQVVLENSRAVNTLRLQDLSNKQALTLAEASALAQLDVANLNNRQQAAVQAAQAFLQKDLTEASNDQQVEIFNAQNRIQAILSDTAADNARLQFNASSENQVEQFFANLATQTSQFNKAQENAIKQFDAGQENVINRFNEELANQRDQFNAQNRLVIDQSNAQWRRSIATADTQAINRANELNAAALLDISNTAYNDLWQYYADTMEFAYQSAESERDRQIRLAIAELQAKVTTDVEAAKRDQQSAIGFGKLIGTFLTAEKDSVIGSLLPI